MISINFFVGNSKSTFWILISVIFSSSSRNLPRKLHLRFKNKVKSLEKQKPLRLCQQWVFSVISCCSCFMIILWRVVFWIWRTYSKSLCFKISCDTFTYNGEILGNLKPLSQTVSNTSFCNVFCILLALQSMHHNPLINKNEFFLCLICKACISSYSKTNLFVHVHVIEGLQNCQARGSRWRTAKIKTLQNSRLETEPINLIVLERTASQTIALPSQDTE